MDQTALSPHQGKEEMIISEPRMLRQKDGYESKASLVKLITIQGF